MFVAQHDLPEHTKDLIDRLTLEFIRENGYITCEFSAPEEQVIALHRYIQQKNRELPDYGMWRIFLCETCHGYHANSPYHVEIQVVDE